LQTGLSDKMPSQKVEIKKRFLVLLSHFFGFIILTFLRGILALM
jgi:hypothetical protein